MVKKEFILITIVTILLDQLSKYWILISKPELTYSLLKIHYITNTGAGFGILQGQTFILGLISLAVTIAIIYYYKEIPKKTQPLYALLLGGVVGNGLDRFFRKFVIDFIDFSFWPAFNIADSAIVVAVIGLLYYYTFIEKS